MEPSANGLPALLLLALAGGFAFVGIYWRTRYAVLRVEGQQLYFYAAVSAVVLVFLSRFLLLGASWIIPDPSEALVVQLWANLLGPLHMPAVTTFIGAFVLGVVGPWLLNRLTNQEKIAAEVIREHGDELTQLLYRSMVEASLLLVVLDNKKVYVGWPSMLPFPKARRDDAKEYLGLLPVKSGYLEEKTLAPHFTIQYSSIYQLIAERETSSSHSPSETDPIAGLDMMSFQILIPISRITLIRPFSFLEPELFKIPSQHTDAES